MSCVYCANCNFCGKRSNAKKFEPKKSSWQERYATTNQSMKKI